MACGGWSDTLSQRIQAHLKERRLHITPYYLRLIQESHTEDSITKHPLWRQVVPFWREEAVGGYDGMSENWEQDHEMKTSICQHKYDNRVILRMANTCVGYCQFCFEALRTLNPQSEKPPAKSDSFQESLEYIKNTPSIEEVILSGGDPLVLSDRKLGKALAALREINEDLLLRIHTRTLSFNPYRVTDDLLLLLETSVVHAFGVHVCHPLELSKEFQESVKRIRSVVPIVFANIPLLRGVNDEEETLHRLFIDLYRLGVKPYYLYHFMPFSPGSQEYDVPIKHAIRIMSHLKRRVSNIALPEYVLPHVKGKFTVPLVSDPKHMPRFEEVGGEMYYRFVNWQGEWCDWRDTLPSDKRDVG